MISPIKKHWKNSSINSIFNRLDEMKPISKEESEEKEVNIKVEAEKLPKKSHYGSIFLAIFIILIILAIGFAAYYFLTNYLD